MEERLHLLRNDSARFFLDIAAAVRKDFALVDIPDFFQIGADFFVKNGLAIYFCFYITGRRVNFATLSSDEFKKTAAAKKNLCGCRSNWRLEAKKSPVVPGK